MRWGGTGNIWQNSNFAMLGAVPFENGRMGMKDIEHVATISSFWSWFNIGLVPLLWPSGEELNEVRGNMKKFCTSDADRFNTFGYNGNGPSMVS